MFSRITIISLSFLTIGAQAVVVFLAVYFILSPKARESFLARFISKNSINLGLAVSLIATLGSLFFSEVAGFEPCRLCWFQRIFMYPQVVILGLAWLKKDSKIIDYAMSLSATGAFIALYHNYIYYTAQKAAFCSATTPCTAPYILEFGYVTIPLMALTAFLTLTLIFSVKIFQKKRLP